MRITDLLVAALATCFAFPAAQAQEPAAADDDEAPFIVEYYYKIKWGHQDEFLGLYKKNHWPLLQDAMESGDILEVSAVAPFNHASEDKRWDLRVTIVWRNASIPHDTSFDMEPILARLFPDRETFEREEKRRFELIEEHMDLPIAPYDVAE